MKLISFPLALLQFGVNAIEASYIIMWMKAVHFLVHLNESSWYRSGMFDGYNNSK